MSVPALVQQAHGAMQNALEEGRLFFGTNAVAGLALVTTATGGGHPTLWNPANSGVNIRIHSLEISVIDGTNAVGSLGWYKTLSTGSAVATGAPIATFTNVAPSPCLVGGSFVSKVYWAPTTNTFTAAPVFHANIPLNLYPITQTTAWGGLIYQIPYGDISPLGIAPGAALSICSINATTTSKVITKVVWEEVDVP